MEHVIKFYITLLFSSNYIIPKSLKVGHWLSEHFLALVRGYNMSGDDFGVGMKTPSKQRSVSRGRYKFLWQNPFVREEGFLTQPSWTLR